MFGGLSDTGVFDVNSTPRNGMEKEVGEKRGSALYSLPPFLLSVPYTSEHQVVHLMPFFSWEKLTLVEGGSSFFKVGKSRTRRNFLYFSKFDSKRSI